MLLHGLLRLRETEALVSGEKRAQNQKGIVKKSSQRQGEGLEKGSETLLGESCKKHVKRDAWRIVQL